LYASNQRSKEQYQRVPCEAEYRTIATVTCEIQWLFFFKIWKFLLSNHLFYILTMIQQDILQQIQCFMSAPNI